jgi:uncharacterized protein YbjT (DUF2867 family)
MERVLITGGSGLLGSRLIPLLMEAGYTVRISSRRERQPGYAAALEWAQASLTSGEGLEEALRDVDAIIHAASTPFKARQVDTEGARRLIDAARGTGVRHFMYISIVGVDRHPLGYYQAKLATENMVQEGGLPWTILRATQFHQLVDKFFLPALFSLPFVGLVPKAFRFQLIDPGEVAQRMSELVMAGPSGRAEDIGGPLVQSMGDLAASWVRARDIRKRIINLPWGGAVGRAFKEGVNTIPGKTYGKITWEEYLAGAYPG